MEEKLVFKSENHEYFLDGVKLPCVSDVLRLLSDEEYEGISESILENAKQKGTEVHEAIELFLKYKFANIREEYKGYFEAFKKWYEQFTSQYEILDLKSEYRTYHRTLMYAGTVDLVIKAKDIKTGMITIFMIDIKTTSSLNLKYVAVQTSGYQKAVESHKEIYIDKRYVLHLKKNEDYYFGELEDKFNVFLSCLTVTNYLK